MSTDSPKRNAGMAPGSFGEATNGNRKDTSELVHAQEWRRKTPPHLCTLVDLHRRYRPGGPLPEKIQRDIGRHWSQS